MEQLTEIGKVIEITDDGKAIIKPNPGAMSIIQTGDSMIIYNKDGEMYAAKIHNEDIEIKTAEFDPHIKLTIPTSNKPVIDVKRISKYGNSNHIIIDKTMMEAGGFKESDLVYVYLLKVEDEIDG